MMKYFIAVLIQVLFLSGAIASVGITWEKKDLPEMTYLFREHGSAFGNDKENTESNKKSLEAVKSLIEEAKIRKLNFIKPAFFRFDLKAGKVLEVGLEIQDKNIDKTKVRLPGKYLMARYEGKLGEIGQVFAQLSGKLKEQSLTLLSEESYYQKKTGTGKNSDSFIILFPLKEK